MKYLPLMIMLATLGGCASQQTQQTPVSSVAQQQTVSGFDALNLSALKIYNKAVRVEQTINGTTPHIRIADGVTPVLGWQLPDYGAYRFQLDSFVQRTHFANKANAFMAEIWLLDKQMKPVQKLTSDRLKYSKQSMLTREALTEEFVLDLRVKREEQPVYLVILTTPGAMKQKVEVANFDREYAKARSVQAPPTPDVFATASASGTIRLEVTPLVSQSFKDQSHSETENKAVERRPDYVPSADIQQAKSVAEKDSKSISDRYIETVQQAIKSGKIQQAIKMRTSVQELHSRLQQQFASLYGQAKDSIQLPAISSSASSSITEQLNEQLSRKLAVYIKQDKPQAALALIDSLKQLEYRIDRSF
ncbi:hypothetical protein EOPP23_04965 [Endozoicomonas sp. OPT23]|uniref:MalM family protein n=1 Tax=Endozoicomonas sp. OPT23 TaxID=2072845 RepID=UPI00129B113E|nr:MalM family protein [Endozoicomonas sp. OPT23]MRI32332.1 hypothetical protein [Endozoicomonas sp. OPT23]